ncbi:pyridoxamine 5'-phosphate oxidase family protein [Faecalitalea cylindroides]|uniref:pyridoxamine 5'-phosphate oxidase family protein n=1 Tax=Faecalitalea cylindroides TaxID=39483 RepID=UPI0024938309|nr:pyridoxamine 5'-phosphate oxidase family protein [Faecalitalea cylindroides]
MRRFKQELPYDECLHILQKNHSGTLALCDKESYPYALPLSYVYDENCIYFHSAKEGHKIDILQKNPKVSFCIIDQDVIQPLEYTTYFKSVIVFGNIEILEDNVSKIEPLKKLGSKYAPNNTEEALEKEIQTGINNLVILKMNIVKITGKQAVELIKK